MKKQIHFGSKSCKNNFNLEFESQYELEKAIQTEVSRATVAEEELLNRLQGISEDSSSVTDPFKYLGTFGNYDEFNSALDELTYQGQGSGYGYFRAFVGTMAIDIKSILVSSVHNAVGQVVQGMLTLNGDKKLTLANGTYKIYFRKHQNNDWSDWKDITTATSNSGSSSNGDINLSDYVTKVEFEEAEDNLITRIGDVESSIPDVRINNESILEDAIVNLEQHFKTINDKSIFASENDTSLKCVEKVLIDGDIHLNPEDGVLDLRGLLGDTINPLDYATKTELQNTKESIHIKIDFQDTQLREMIEDVEDAALKGIKLNNTPIAPDDDGYINLELSGNGDITVDPNEVYATKVALEEVEDSLITRIGDVESSIPDVRVNNESIVNDSKIVNLEEHFKTINDKSIFASENDTSLKCVEKVLIDGDIHLNPEDGVLDLRGIFGESNLSDYVTNDEFEEVEDSLITRIGDVESSIPDVRINNESIVNDSKIVNLEEHFKTINDKSIFASENDTSLKCVEKVLIDGDIHLNPEDGVLDLRGIFGESNLSDYVTNDEFEEVEDSLITRIGDVESSIPDVRVNNESIVNDSKVVNLEEHFKTINGKSILGSGDITISGSGDINLSDYATKVALEEVEDNLTTQIGDVESSIPDVRINNESIINDSKIVNLEEHFKTINDKSIFASENDTSLKCVEKVLIDGDIHLNPEDGVLDLRGIFGESNLSDYVTKDEFEEERDSVWEFLNGVEELIPDIKINGESIINDSNVVNIPVASTTEHGVTILATEINENSDDEHAVTPAAVYWELDALRAETKNLYGQKIYTNSPIGGVAYLTPLKQGKTIVTSEISGIESFILQGSVDDERYMEFYLAFKTSATIGSFAFPDDLIWANSVTPTIEENTYYELSIVVVNMKSNNEDQDILIRKAVLTPFK